MGQYQKHVFICTYGSYCPHNGDTEALLKKLKKGIAAAGLQDDIRINRSGCLNQCGHGPMVVVYPENVWYAGVQADDADEILQSHLLGGKPVERLLYNPGKPGANKNLSKYPPEVLAVAKEKEKFGMVNGNGKKIAVFGGGGVDEGSPAWEEALQVGRMLAEAGFTVMNGGYQGTMTAVSRGARLAGGRVIGVTSDLFATLTPNPWLTEERRTADLYGRLRALTEEADGYLTLRGSIGTLSELLLTWTLLYTGNVPPRPLVLLGESYRRFLDALAATTNLTEQECVWVRVVDTATEAMDALRSHFP